MKQYIGHLVAAQITQQYPNVGDHIFVALITPYKTYNDRVSYYWENGPSRSDSAIINIKVLYVYGFEDEQDDTWWDRVDLHFLTNYYPAKVIEPKPDHNGRFYGFIDPQGNYYMAHYGNHDWTARSIYASLYNEVLPGYEAREALLKTWIMCNERFLIGRDDFETNQYDITEKQVKTVDKIRKMSGLELSYESRKVVND